MRVKREDIVASRVLGSKLSELGRKLKSPRLSDAYLLKLLQEADIALVSTKKAPLPSALESMRPFLNAIVIPSLLKHQDKDVILLVASCLCEITRITSTALYFRYSDKIMRDIFGLIVSTFSGLNDSSEPSFKMRVRILEVLANPRHVLQMLDLGCDDLVTETFQSFIAFARDDHPDNVISFMETIMVMLVEKSDDVQDDTLLALLSSLGRNKNDTTEAARNLAISVINRCIVKFEPVLKQLLISLMSGNSGSSECQIDCHEVILNLYPSSPGILSGIVPYLTEELSAKQSETRLRALRLVGELFTIPGHAIPEAFQPIHTEFMNRLNDTEVEVRMTALDCIKRHDRNKRLIKRRDRVNLENKRLVEEISPGDDVNFKRARYNKSNKSDESNSNKSYESYSNKSYESYSNKSEESNSNKSEESNSNKSDESNANKSEESNSNKSDESSSNKSDESNSNKSEESNSNKSDESNSNKSDSDESNSNKSDEYNSNKSDESSSDVSILTLMASAQEQKKNKSNSGEKVDCDNTTIIEPIFDANVALIERQSHEAGEDSLSITTLECVPNSLRSLFHTPVPDFVRRAVVDGVKAIAEAVSHFSENPYSARSEILDNLEALKGVAKVAKVTDSRISWIVSQVNVFFDGVDAVVKLEGEVSPTTLREVSAELSLCDVEIACDERELHRLQDRSLVMKEREKSILEMEAKLCKMKEDFAADTEELVKCTSEVERRIQLNKEKKQGLEEIEKAKQAKKAKLEELNSKRALIQTIARDLSSFASND